MRTYIQFTGVVFAIVALAHAVRSLLDWPAQVASWAVPIWISWVATLGAGALCIWAFRLVSRARQ